MWSAVDVHAATVRLHESGATKLAEMVAHGGLGQAENVHRIPMLVVGAEDDTIVSPRQIWRTAAVDGTHAEMFPNMGHDMMLETGWQAVAEHMLGWLHENFPGSSPTRALRPE